MDGFIGEIKLFAGDYSPRNTIFCMGDSLPISDYAILYSVIKDNYFSNNTTLFMIPDLRGRVPRHPKGNEGLGYIKGSSFKRLEPKHLPKHNHLIKAAKEDAIKSVSIDQKNILAKSKSKYSLKLYNDDSSNLIELNNLTEPYNNNYSFYSEDSFLGLNYCLCHEGLYPSVNQNSGNIIGQIKLFVGDYAPSGWELCNGQELSIAENPALYSIVGNKFGLSSYTSFKLPDLRGRVPKHNSKKTEYGGNESIILTTNEMPTHNHTLVVSNEKGENVLPEKNNVLSSSSNEKSFIYSDYQDKMEVVNLNENMISSTNDAEPLYLDDASLNVNYIISTSGVYPSKTGSETEGIFYNTIGEITLFSGDYAPGGWEFCDGKELLINENRALYSIIDTYFGGDGVKTFKLPNLTDRVAKGFGSGAGLPTCFLGQQGGSNTTELKPENIPAHTHSISASASNATTSNPEGMYLSVPKDRFNAPYVYSSNTANTRLFDEIVSNEGNGAKFNSESPYLNLRFIICTNGQYPVRY